jgi:hypothetical protein
MKRVFCSLFLLGCSVRLYDSGGGTTVTGDPSPSAGVDTTCGTTVDADRELLIVDPNVLGDPRAAWTFGARLEEIAGAHAPADTASGWLAAWTTVTSVGGAPVTPRPGVSVLADAWKAQGWDPARAPFRLIAIVNRVDLRDDPAACVGSAGELRFVYNAVDAKGAALAMTVIVEIPYPKTKSPHDWAAAWHALGGLDFGPAYDDALEALTRSVTEHVDVRTVRLRTNESVFGDGWELREFGATTEGTLDQVALDSTPRQDLDGSYGLASWVTQNASVVASGTWVLPASMRAGAAPVPAGFRWSVPGVSSTLRSELSTGTCNGCHGGETSALPFQHLAMGDPNYDPGQTTTRVSPFLRAELGRRAQSMTNALCSTCDTSGSSSSPYAPEPTSPSCSK